MNCGWNETSTAIYLSLAKINFAQFFVVQVRVMFLYVLCGMAFAFSNGKGLSITYCRGLLICQQIFYFVCVNTFLLSNV